MNRMCMMIEQILATDRVMNMAYLAECEKRDATGTGDAACESVAKARRLAWETTLETYRADIAEAKDSLRSLIT